MTAVVARAWSADRRIACGCFGGSGELEYIGPHSLVRTSGLAVLAILAGVSSRAVGGPAAVALAIPLAAAGLLIVETVRLLTSLRVTTDRLIVPALASRPGSVDEAYLAVKEVS
jgi:hypothetical protein